MLTGINIYIASKINQYMFDKITYVDLINDNEYQLGGYEHNNLNESILIKKNHHEIKHTILHEMFHSTGHKTRLNRFNDNTVGSFYKQLNLNVYNIGTDNLVPLAKIIEETIVEQAIYNLNWKKYHNNYNNISCGLFYWKVELNELNLNKELKTNIREIIEYQAKLINKNYRKYLFWKKIETIYKLITYKTI